MDSLKHWNRNVTITYLPKYKVMPLPYLKKTSVLGKMCVHSMLKFVYDCKASLRFSDDELKEVLNLYSGKYSILSWGTCKQNTLTGS
jgi:hypothetical protein